MTRWPICPRLGRAFFKAHGLGNDYLVFEEGDDWTASPEAVRRVCDPHRGVGSDGIVALLADPSGGVPRVRMFNPDGGEFERSGNGLRVLGAFLGRRREPSPYRLSVGGEEVTVTIHGSEGGAWDVSVAMGRARVGPDAIELDAAALGPDSSLGGPGGEALSVVPVSVGNPHLVVLEQEVTAERLAVLGPYLVAHPSIANGTNVQLAEPLGSDRCAALVWERGVGPTSASGTSACAVAVALVVRDLLAPGSISVDMPGGRLSVSVSADLETVLRGPVEEVCEGVLALPLLAD